MGSKAGIRERKKTDEMDALLKADKRMIKRILKNTHDCQKEALLSTLNGDISLCRCGTYHVRIDTTTLHMTETQFYAAARLFKLAFGILAGRRPCF